MRFCVRKNKEVFAEGEQKSCVQKKKGILPNGKSKKYNIPMQIKSYKDAVRYLESFIGKVRFEITPEFLKHHDPLERMRVLLSLLGNPQDKFSSVLVGGTSGKGSTAYLISHTLTTAGYKIGLTLSPHLQKVNERLQINGEPISDGEFVDLVSSIVQTIELMEKERVGGPSYFEILIAMAFLYFAEQKVDIAVVEVGIGGEFDATNTLYPLVAVLTNVSLDHTNVLGGTVQKIARTKAGIIKRRDSLRSLRQFKNFSNASVPAAHYRSPRDTVAFSDSSEKFSHAKAPRESANLIVVTGVTQPSVVKIVEDKCKEVGTELYRLHKDFDFKIKEESFQGSVFDLISYADRRKKLSHLALSLLGKHQIENASLAIETVLQLEKFGFRVSEDHIRRALKSAFFPGRFEIVKIDSLLRRASLAQDKTSSTLVLDGAHNPTKMKAFLKTLKKLYPKNPKIFIVAFKSDKDIKSMLSQILKLADKVIITEFTAKTDMSKNASAGALNLKSQISRLAEASASLAESRRAKRANLKTDAKVIVEKDPKRALQNAIRASAVQQYNNSTIVVVTGSLYLVGEIRNML